MQEQMQSQATVTSAAENLSTDASEFPVPDLQSTSTESSQPAVAEERTMHNQLAANTADIRISGHGIPHGDAELGESGGGMPTWDQRR